MCDGGKVIVERNRGAGGKEMREERRGGKGGRGGGRGQKGLKSGRPKGGTKGRKETEGEIKNRSK